MTQYKQAWYSPEAALRYGTSWYQDEQGSAVEITAICENSDYNFADKKDVGKVGPFLRLGREGIQRFFDFAYTGDNYLKQFNVKK